MRIMGPIYFGEKNKPPNHKKDRRVVPGDNKEVLEFITKWHKENPPKPPGAAPDSKKGFGKSDRKIVNNPPPNQSG